MLELPEILSDDIINSVMGEAVYGEYAGEPKVRRARVKQLLVKQRDDTVKKRDKQWLLDKVRPIRIKQGFKEDK